MEFATTGLNDDGDIAFRYILADGTKGVAVASVVPEPGSALLVTLGLAGLLTRGRYSKHRNAS